MNRKVVICVILAAALLAVAATLMAGIPQLINYQGRLLNSVGTPLDTTVAMIYSLYGDSTGGSPFWADTIDAVAVTKGLFSVIFDVYDPGDGSYGDDSIKYVGIKVGNDPEISPRTRVTSAPFALRTARVESIDGAAGGTIYGNFAMAPAPSGAKKDINMPAGTSKLDVGGTLPFSATCTGSSPSWLGTLNVFGNNVTTPTITLDGSTGKIILPNGAANGLVLTSDANGVGSWASLTAISSDDDWDKKGTGPEYLETHGAWGIARFGNTLWGTNRNTHVNLGDGCTTGRSGQNYGWATIGGGQSNEAIGHFTTIGGGYENKIGNSGVPTADEARLATIAGGYANEAHAVGASVGGGEWNIAYDACCAIAGGYGNLAGLSGISPTEAYYAYIGGGLRNYAQAGYSTIGGGLSNQAAGLKSTIGGGDSNYVSAGALRGTISGGYFNQVNDIGATIGGGYNNTTETSSPYATIGGGNFNRVTDYAGTIAGGELDTVLAEYGTVGGGNEHYIETHANWGTIAGGNVNRVIDSGGAILGGQQNTAAGSFASIGGGQNNQTGGHCSVIPGGHDNIANGRFSLAAGQSAQSLHDGSFVWNDNSAGVFASTSQNQFLIHAAGNTGIMTNAPHSTLHDNGSIAVGFRSTNVNYTATTSDCIIEGVPTLPVTLVINLPPAAGVTGRVYTIKNTGGPGTTVEVNANGLELIDGSVIYNVSSYLWVTIVSNGTKWLIIGN